jgi:hypothetical protein
MDKAFFEAWNLLEMGAWKATELVAKIATKRKERIVILKSMCECR